MEMNGQVYVQPALPWRKEHVMPIDFSFKILLLHYPLIYAHVSLDLLAKILYTFFIPCVYASCSAHFILHIIIQIPAWGCMAAWLWMWGGNQGYGKYTIFHENQDVVHYLLMDISFSLSYRYDNTSPNFLLKWNKWAKSWTEQRKLNFEHCY